MAAPKSSATARKPRRKDKKNIPVGQAHIRSTFNNTIITITDPTGAVISWSSQVTLGSRDHVSQLLSQRSWQLNQLLARLRSTASRR